jgi:hypothetical protein
LDVPSLNERREDIPLANFFAEKIARAGTIIKTLRKTVSNYKNTTGREIYEGCVTLSERLIILGIENKRGRCKMFASK